MNQLSIGYLPERDPDKGEASLRIVVRVDGKPLLDFARFELAADLAALQESLQRDGEYFIITCSCGDPGCAEIKREFVSRIRASARRGCTKPSARTPSRSRSC